MSDESTRYRAAPDVLFQEVNGEVVLLDLEAEKYFGLNQTGARVWQLVKEGNHPDRIIESLEAEYRGERSAIATDVEQLLAELLSAGLLVRE